MKNPLESTIMKSPLSNAIKSASGFKQLPHRFRKSVNVNDINVYMSYIKVDGSKKIGGLGVFALRDFEANEVVEVCPVIHCSKEDIKGDSILRNYIFASDKGQEYSGVALGYGALYNHSTFPNLNWYYDRGFMVIWAIKDIEKGSELFISYGEEWWKSRNLVSI